MLDIIIPVCNEEHVFLQDGDYFRSLSKKAALTFVDGGSTDKTRQMAGAHGAVVLSAKGKATQKNAGAAATRAPYILFLNADTVIHPQSVDAIVQALEGGAEGGCLRAHIAGDERIFRYVERWMNWRASSCGILDADAGMFVRRELFTRVGGFDQVPFMEDILLSRKIRSKEKIVHLDEPIMVSSRKWLARGLGRACMEYPFAYFHACTRFRFVR